MKIYQIRDIKEFEKVIGKCGDVRLVSRDGEHDLKKELAKLKEVDGRFGRTDIRNIEIRTTKPEDTLRLINYLIAC